MQGLLQISAIVTVFGLTFAFFSLVGSTAAGLLIDKKTGQQWQRTIRGSFGSYLTATSIFGTLTSLATVYVFFIGSSKLFGWWLIACCISLIIGGFISNALTTRIIALPRPRAVLSSNLQDGAVLASLFWNESAPAAPLVRLIRLISLIGMAGVVWLEFAVFGDVSGHLLGFGTAGKASLVGLIAALVFMFTFRYGLRGFVVADLLHSALIASAVLLIAAGTAWLYATQHGTTGLSGLGLGAPIADATTCILIVLNVFVVNAFWVVVSESHWLRMWLFERREMQVQFPAQFATATVWLLLIVIGWMAHALTGGKLGDESIKNLLGMLSEHSYVFAAAFWLGGTAALFSTADVQSYCFRLVQAFDPNAGRIPANTKTVTLSSIWPLVLGGAAGAVYYIVRELTLPFDKLVFTLIPFSQNAVPAFLQLAFGLQVTLTPTIVALVLYISLATWGFSQPANSVALNLMAAVVPPIIGGIAVLWGRRTKHGK